MPTRLTPLAALGTALMATALVLGGCSSTPGPVITTPTSAPSTSTTSTTSPSTTSSTAGATRVPMQTATGGEFYSPSHNISCEINSAPPAGSMDAAGKPLQPYAMCLTISPPRRASLSAEGAVTQCTGSTCLSNAGVNTPTLPFGSETGAGPFTCRSEATGMTCTVPSGKGFTIATAGITTIG